MTLNIYNSFNLLSKLERYFDNISFLLLGPIFLSVFLFYLVGLSLAFAATSQQIILLVLTLIILLIIKFYIVGHYESEYEKAAFGITEIFSMLKYPKIYENRIKNNLIEYNKEHISNKSVLNQTQCANQLLSEIKSPKQYIYFISYSFVNIFCYAVFWTGLVASILQIFSIFNKLINPPPILFYFLLIPFTCIFLFILLFSLNVDWKAIKKFVLKFPYFAIIHTSDKDYSGLIINEDEKNITIAQLLIEDDLKLEEAIRLHRVEFEIPKHNILSIEKHFIKR